MRFRQLLPMIGITSLMLCGTMGVLIRPAAAVIVCDKDGDDCWHVDHRYDHPPPGITFEYHPDQWYFDRDWNDHDWDHDHHNHWHRERHDGRGYWRNGLWITF
jgi:hypothetical protein